MMKYYATNKTGYVTIFRRYKSSNPKKPKSSKKYSNTVILPVTEFPNFVNSSERINLDKYIEKKCEFSQQYKWQEENNKGPEFILHDGPPYANGPAHMGHAVNKILKDITLRRKLLDGYKVNYKPGWDCHGLPIENKVLNMDESFTNSPLDTREKARKFAIEAIEKQKSAFKTWGLLADWNNCYYTFDKSYMQNQLRQFLKLYEKELVYRDLKPVYWSPSSRTALAEAELEYNENHISKSIVFRVKLNVSAVSSEIQSSDLLYGLVWTTTPWTIPGNHAIAYNANAAYSLVKIPEFCEVYLIASNLVDELQQKIGKELQIISTIPGSILNVVRYEHPLERSRILPFFPGTHVVTSKGTGLVHIAPAHGKEDFLLGIINKLPVKSIVDEKGHYLETVGDDLIGLDALSDGEDAVIEKLKDDVLFSGTITHSYPYDWRTKKPVILRASEQWFIDTNRIKGKAMEYLQNVTVEPEYSGARLRSQLNTRPYWCISRQRVWGIPIPVLYHKSSKDIFINQSFIEHCCNLVEKYGSDFWWSLPVSELLPHDLKCDPSFQDIKKGEDILDIWFDSGLSWSYVLGENKIADVYLEGIDQCTGWFQSSLLTSVGLRDKAPYKTLFVHGFAVDSSRKKMSKSLGNVVDPQDMIMGTNNHAPYGVDVFRWWVGAHTVQHTHIEVTDGGFNESKETIQKLRNTFKFLLGILKDYVPPSDSITYPLSIFDQYVLHELFQYYSIVDVAYEDFKYNKVCLATIDFVSNTLSSLYLHLTKDRLYCEARDSDRRRSCQQVSLFILEIVLNAIAPITPHLVEEIYLYHPLYNEKKQYFRTMPMRPNEDWYQPEIDNKIEKIFDLKKQVTRVNPVDIKKIEAHIVADSLTLDVLKFEPYELTELFQTANVSFEKNLDQNDKNVIMIHETRNTLCLRCRRYICVNNQELCARCDEVLSATLKTAII